MARFVLFFRVIGNCNGTFCGRRLAVAAPFVFVAAPFVFVAAPFVFVAAPLVGATVRDNVVLD